MPLAQSCKSSRALGATRPLFTEGLAQAPDQQATRFGTQGLSLIATPSSAGNRI